MRVLVAVALLLGSSLAAGSDLVSAVPSQFLGEWNARLADCGTDDNETSLRIKKSHLAYYESDGPIKAVVSHGRYEVALIVELSGEGQTWLTTEHFQLSPDGEELTSINLPGDGFVRRKCPAE